MKEDEGGVEEIVKFIGDMEMKNFFSYIFILEGTGRECMYI